MKINCHNPANRNGFDDDEAKAAFVANVFCQTEGSETALCGNQAGFLMARLLPQKTSVNMTLSVVGYLTVVVAVMIRYDYVWYGFK